MLDIEKAFKFPANDPKLGSKFLIGGFISLILLICNTALSFLPEDNKALIIKFLPLVLVAFFLLIVSSVILGGYFYEVLNKRMREESDILPDWKNIFKLTLNGIKAFLGAILLFIPFGIFILFLCLSAFAVKSISFVLIIPFISLIMLTVIVYVLISALMNISFGYDLKILSFFNFKRGLALLKNNTGQFLLYAVFISAIVSLLKIIAFCLNLTVIGFLAVPFLIFYTMLIIADFGAQFARNSELNITKEGE